ncbi:MAG TPA: right-handed parallel beta-helix repeat-containing protein [Mycobacteriales bacterium]
MSGRPWALALAGALVLAVSPHATAATVQVDMKDNVYLPAETAIQPGDTVTWLNRGRSPHNVTYGDKSKQSPAVEPGQTYSITFPNAGTYYYYCSFHSSGSGKGMAGVIKVGTGGPTIGAPQGTSGPGNDTGPQVRRVPSQYKTIQKAVDAAKPGDVVLVSPGVYKEQVTVTTSDITIRGLDRNKTIVDGEFTRPMGFLVQDADNVVIENITARYTTLNNFYWTGADGFRGSYLTSYNSGDYGIYSFASQHGVFEDSWASGSRDSGFYIGQCKPCHQTIRRVKATLSGLGYSGTNAGGDLLITDSEWWDNYGGGITPNTLDSEENPPQQDIVITNNYVHGNQNRSAPYKDPAFASVYGMGIAVAGGEDDVVKNNRVEDHLYFGIVVLPIPGIGPGPVPDAPVTGNFYPTKNNRVEGNKVSGSGVADLALGTAAGGGNCFDGNEYETSLPLAIEATYSCSNPPPGGGDPAVTAVAASNLARAESGELAPGDWKTQPAPPAQPNMPNADKVTFRPIGSVGQVGGSGSGSGGGTGLPNTGEPFPTLPVGLALVGGAAVWAGARSYRRRRS